MPIHTFDFRKAPPAKPSAGWVYIKPGEYKADIAAYDDKESSTGKEMHSFTLKITSKGDERGKQIIDRFAMPTAAEVRKSPNALFPVSRLNALFQSTGIKVPEDRAFKFDPNKLVGKSVTLIIADEMREAQGDFPARLGSKVSGYLLPSKKAVVRDDDDDDEDEDEEDEDEDELDDEEDDEEEEEDDDEDEEDDEDEDEEEEEEEPEPAPRARRNGRSAPAAPAKKAKASAPAKGKRKAAVADDDFPFDD